MKTQGTRRELRSFNEIRKNINKQNELFTRKIETITKKQTNSGAEEFNE